MLLAPFAGYARSGKDTAGEAFASLGWTKKSFASPVKAIASALNPWIRTEVVKGTSGCILRYNFSRLQDLIEELGPEKVKEIPEVRKLYQNIGTEAGRDILGEDTWVNYFDNDLDLRGQTYVTDVRFPNEACYLRDHMEAPVIWINKPGVGPANSHVSEQDIRHLCTVEIDNDSTIEELHRRVLKYVGDWYNIKLL